METQNHIQCLMFMLEKQENLNNRINPYWKEERQVEDFLTAIFTEIAEFIESTDYKWWKTTEEDIFNQKLELIDIFHFLLSYLIIYKDLPINKSVFGENVSIFDTAVLLDTAYKKATPDMEVIRGLQRMFVNLFTSTEAKNDFDYTFLDLPLSDYFSVVKARFDSFEEFFKLYLIKLSLNHLRQIQGYNEGSYEKLVDGVEDNERFYNAVKDFDLKTIDIDNVENELIDLYVRKLGV